MRTKLPGSSNKAPQKMKFISVSARSERPSKGTFFPRKQKTQFPSRSAASSLSSLLPPSPPSSLSPYSTPPFHFSPSVSSFSSFPYPPFLHPSLSSIPPSLPPSPLSLYPAIIPQTLQSTLLLCRQSGSSLTPDPPPPCLSPQSTLPCRRRNQLIQDPAIAACPEKELSPERPINTCFTPALDDDASSRLRRHREELGSGGGTQSSSCTGAVRRDVTQVQRGNTVTEVKTRDTNDVT